VTITNQKSRHDHEQGAAAAGQKTNSEQNKKNRPSLSVCALKFVYKLHFEHCWCVLLDVYTNNTCVCRNDAAQIQIKRG